MSKKHSYKRIYSCHILKKTFTVILAITILFIIFSCTFFYDILYTTVFPPVSSYKQTPINIKKANSIVSTSVKIHYNRVYDNFRFNLVFALEGVTDKNNPAYIKRRELLAKFVGQTDYSPGITLPIRLTISKKEEKGRVIYHEKIYATKDCRAWRDNSFIRQITILHLLPGHYQVQIENIKKITNAPDGIKVTLEIVQAGSK